MRTKRPIGVRNADQFRDKIAKYTDMVVHIARHFGKEPRAYVTQAIRDALEGGDDIPCFRTMALVREPGGTPEDTEVASMPGMYRYLFDYFGFDRTDLVAQESLFAYVREVLDGLCPEGRR